MDAWTYHQNVFPEHVRTFFASLHRGPRVRNVGDGVVRDPMVSFHLADLTRHPGPDHLAHVPSSQLPFFVVSLTYVVLINQVVHAHFRSVHSDFWKHTRYPIVAGGLNPCRSPYDILATKAWAERGLGKDPLMSAWEQLLAHVVEDLGSLEEVPLKHLGLTVSGFRDAALSDMDVVGPQPWGAAVIAALA